MRRREGARGRPGAFGVGLWSIRFTNGVSGACVPRADGTTSVLGEKRAADGKTERAGRAVLLFFADEGVERWTPVGQETVVEHWSPAANFPAGSPVLDIGKRSP